MNKPRMFLQYAPADGAADGGAAVATPAYDSTSHHTEAAKLFEGDAPAPAGSDEPEIVAPAAPAGDAAKPPVVAKPDPKAGAEPEKKAPSVFDQLEPAKPIEKKEGDKPPVVENPEDKIQLSPKAKPETAKAFDDIKVVAKQLRTEIATRDARIAELEKGGAGASGADSPEFEKLQADHKAALDRLALVDLKSHPTFHKQFIEPKNAAIENVKNLLEYNAVEGVDIAGILAKPRAEFSKAVNEIAAKLPPFDQATFANEMRGLQTLESRAADALKNAGTVSADITKASSDRARAAFNETLATLDFSKNGAMKTVEIPENASPEDREYFERYNASAANLVGESEKIAFGGMDDKTVARVALESSMFRHFQNTVIPRMVSEHKRAAALISDLTTQIHSLKGRKGAASRTQDAPPGGGGEKKLEEMGAEEAAAHVFGGR